MDASAATRPERLPLARQAEAALEIYVSGIFAVRSKVAVAFSLHGSQRHGVRGMLYRDGCPVG